MRDNQRKFLVKEIDERWKKLEVELWELAKWADMAFFPSQSRSNPQGRSIGDPTGDKATAGILGHYDDPAIQASKDADRILWQMIRVLDTLERAIAVVRNPHVVSERDKEQCDKCGIFRFEKPDGWTLGYCNGCYASERRKRMK